MKKFPCPYCKGSGVAEEGEHVDVGIGMVQVSADWPCNFCDALGMIERGGSVHKRIVASQIATKILGFHRVDDEMPYEDFLKIGYKALELATDPNQRTAHQ